MGQSPSCPSVCTDPRPAVRGCGDRRRDLQQGGRVLYGLDGATLRLGSAKRRRAQPTVDPPITSSFRIHGRRDLVGNVREQRVSLFVHWAGRQQSSAACRGAGWATPMRYEDDARRYQISLCGNWEDRSRHPAVVSTARKVKVDMIAFFKRSGSASLPNLTILTCDVSGHPDIQSAVDYVEVARASGRGGELRVPQPFTHDDMFGVRWEYAYRLEAVTCHSVTDYYLDGRTAILVSSVSEPGRFEQDKEEILPMLNSFRLTTKSGSAGDPPTRRLDPVFTQSPIPQGSS